MKRILLIAVLLGTMITATTYFVCIAAPSVLFGKGIKGSGNIVTRTIDAPDFDRVDAARAVKVVITGKATGKITIEADDNIMEYVVVEAKGGRLTATIDKSVNNVSNADVTVTVPANGRIRALDASSAARITSDVTLTADLHSMGQYIQDGERTLFETIISVAKPAHEVVIEAEAENLDGLNFLAGKRISEVNRMAELGVQLAHVDGGVPNIRVEIPAIDAHAIGSLLYFFEKACGISGYILGVNPFDQPGVEAYKKNMFALLDKPGYEEASKAIKARL